MKLTAWEQFPISVRKAWMVMRLLSFFILFFSLHLSAWTNAQTVTLSADGISVSQFLNQLEKQTSYSFIIKFGDVSPNQKIDVHVKDVSLESVLDQVLKPLGLSYRIDDKAVYILKAVSKESIPENAEIPPGEIHGRITNEHGQPIENANVTIKRTKTGTITDADGKFTLKNVNSTDEIIISYIGYKAQTIKVGDKSNFSFVLDVTHDELDKVVIQAYGTTSQRLTTSDIGKVTAEEIERQPVLNPLLALQGKVAGLDVTQTSGYASAPVKVELRGRSMISPNFPSDPLYIVDGVPLTVLDPQGSSTYAGGSVGFDLTDHSPANGQSPLFSINPNDIESMEVLKDADATAIYGSRGANGVILITTKKGKPGKTKLDLRVQEGVTHVTRFWDMMNTTQYLAMRRQAFSNDGLTPDPVYDYDVNGTWDTTKYTNWQNVLLGGMGKTIDAQASLSGGEANTTFRFGTAYNHTTGITTVSGADQRASFSLNVEHHSLNHRFSISSTSIFSYSKSTMINIPAASTLAPDAPAIYDSLGNLNYAGWGGNYNNTQAEYAYPFFSLLQPYTSSTNFLNSDLVIGYQLFRGFNLSTNFGYNSAQTNQEQVTPIASQNPALNPTGSLFLANNNNKNIIIEPQLNYSTNINNGVLSVLLGASSSQTDAESLIATGSGYTSDRLIQSIANAQTIGAQNNFSEYRYAALYGRLNFIWERKYIFNLNARRDGSSRFGPGKQFGNFGSIGGAWILTEEKWLRDVLPSLVSFLKVRGSYGTTGSDAIGDYGYLSRYSSNGLQPYNSESGLIPTQAPNPNYKWQVNKKLEGAIDLALLKDRINIQAAYYRDRCGNQLIQFPTPIYTGFANIPANSPALVQNDGWEFTVMVDVIKTKKFSWRIDFNTSINRNKLIAYPNFTLSPYVGTYSIGQPLNIVQVLHVTGVDPQTGHYTFEDKNHDGVITYRPGHTPDDSYVINLNPKFFGGLGMDFSYQTIQLSLFFNIKKQIGRNAFESFLIPPGSVNFNQPNSIFAKQWEKPGDIAAISRYTTSASSSDADFEYFSDGGYTDASFIRLSNLSFSYRLPINYTKKSGLQGCSLFFNANNLFVITKYKGLDPETQNFGSIPPVKTIVGGINFNF